ncbi:MAG: DUF1638 domain-containing protein [Thermoleophilia bacterium]|nr:DUF1638 domain-containing protein [Thermoleophilia bacterium]
MRSIGAPTRERKPLALVCCGALAREVRELAELRGWEADLYGASALHHLHPKRIVAAVEERLAEIRDRYERVVVVYGDCGTAGALDEVLARYDAVRPSGPHCYAMFGGVDFDRLAAEEAGTFFLTDWLVRNWELAVVRPLGLDRDPGLKPIFFESYRRVAYLRQSRRPELDLAARRIAAYLGVPLEVRDVGLGELGRELVELVEQPLASGEREPITTAQLRATSGGRARQAWKIPGWVRGS